ncbi:MAG: hypothetical protein KDE51_01285 [Anaerolineales bacterium]|nr:hypothetical protein [Anaerolineales bacterium]
MYTIQIVTFAGLSTILTILGVGSAVLLLAAWFGIASWPRVLRGILGIALMVLGFFVVLPTMLMN